MIKCVLIDDEKQALNMLRKKVQKLFDDIEIAGAFQNPEKALPEVEKLKPDLVFLDIAMPKLSGFDFLSKIKEPDFEVIFVTAYDNYAIEAIKHAAIGYIVKPIDNKELKAAVEKAKKNIQLKVAAQKNKALLELLSPESKILSIPTSNGYVFVKKDNIIRLEGTEGYTKIVCDNQQEHLSSYSLGKFVSYLDSKKFLQVHRSHIVNLSFVTGFLKEGNLQLADNSHVPLSKSKKDEFLKMMKKL